MLEFKDITIRNQLQPGDLGYVIHRHSVLYHKEYGFGLDFESYVARGIFEFYHTYDPRRERIWICEHENKIIGFLLLISRSESCAQLRYFYLEPEFRGIGLGKKLMNLFLDFLRKAGYKSSYLWTTNELFAAASLYRRHGYELTEEKPSTSFGKFLIEQRYDLVL